MGLSPLSHIICATWGVESKKRGVITIRVRLSTCCSYAQVFLMSVPIYEMATNLLAIASLSRSLVRCLSLSIGMVMSLPFLMLASAQIIFEHLCMKSTSNALQKLVMVHGVLSRIGGKVYPAGQFNVKGSGCGHGLWPRSVAHIVPTPGVGVCYSGRYGRYCRCWVCLQYSCRLQVDLLWVDRWWWVDLLG
jgi:hypothetical protein